MEKALYMNYDSFNGSNNLFCCMEKIVRSCASFFSPKALPVVFNITNVKIVSAEIEPGSLKLMSDPYRLLCKRRNKLKYPCLYDYASYKIKIHQWDVDTNSTYANVPWSLRQHEG